MLLVVIAQVQEIIPSFRIQSMVIDMLLSLCHCVVLIDDCVAHYFFKTSILSVGAFVCLIDLARIFLNIYRLSVTWYLYEYLPTRFGKLPPNTSQLTNTSGKDSSGIRTDDDTSWLVAWCCCR